MTNEQDKSDDTSRGSRVQHVWVPLISALILAAAGIIGGLIGHTVTQSKTTTVVETVTAPEADSPESESPPSSPHQATSPSTAACLPSPAKGDAEDNSIGTPRGPIESGHLYRGTLIKGDEEWWGFCADNPGRVDVRVENVCDVQGSGATNLIAELLDSSGEAIESFRVDPGRFRSIPLQVEANSPYYVHIYDLEDVDIGGICGEIPWTLVVTGDLTDQLSA